ncbi:MAG: TIGR01777 family oxidoreductase [Bacteroidales bacterium]|nr:TIGR01777 family oxidoreductase [Bacteroidales bacterium]MCF8388257.1 TIGR01777 family oxidoreductase [Bacteroidales bacterium]MCF8398494.1 TIGR01777 family oxidoreductase [Bacteroidales bacterium]
MKILIFGASGFIGQNLVDELLPAGHEIITVSRNKAKLNKIFDRTEKVDLNNKEEVLSAIQDSNAIINLSGATLARPWTKSRKEKIKISRIGFSQKIIDLIRESGHTPDVFLQGSAVGYYGDRKEEALPEEASPGKGFLPDIVRDWEGILVNSGLTCRKVLLRTSLVLGKSKGILPVIALPVRLFFGGHFGNGRQWFPWIHIKDEVRAIRFAMENDKINGPINLVSPGIVRQKEFMKILAAVMHRPDWFHVPASLLKALMGRMVKEMLLLSQKVLPEKLQQAGFEFEYKELEETLKITLK